jgi:mRNA interferase MazF
MPSSNIVRGDIWDVDLDPTKGHEQAGKRPVLVVSVDQFNQGPSGLVFVVPISSKSKGVRSHVLIKSGEGGLTQDSFAKCEATRSISTDRLIRRRGSASTRTTDEVSDWLRLLLGL